MQRLEIEKNCFNQHEKAQEFWSRTAWSATFDMRLTDGDFRVLQAMAADLWLCKTNICDKSARWLGTALKRSPATITRSWARLAQAGKIERLPGSRRGQAVLWKVLGVIYEVDTVVSDADGVEKVEAKNLPATRTKRKCVKCSRRYSGIGNHSICPACLENWSKTA